MREWSRVDSNALRFKGTDIDGPAWNAVVSRTTYDLTDGKNQIIEHISIDKGVRATNLYRKLPPKVSDIRTILQYNEKPEKRSVRNRKISESMWSAGSVDQQVTR